MPVIQDSHMMDSSSFFVQRPFNGSSDNLSIGTSTNVSPSHQATLHLNHSSSETSIQQAGGGGLGSGGSSLHHSFSNNNNPSGNGGIGSSGNEKTSPLHLSSMLHSFSMGNGLNTSSMSQQHQDMHSSSFNQGAGSYLLKMKNLPQDITLRETYAIFALADGVINIELIKEPKFSSTNSSEGYEFSILAKFGSLPLATHYASILSSKSDIFGPTYPFTSYIEVIDELANQQVSFQRPKFHLSQPNYQLSTSTLPPTPVASVPSTHPQQQQQQHASPISSSGPSSRTGLTQMRLRFSFSDPFSSDPLGTVGTPTSADAQSHQQQTQQSQQSHSQTQQSQSQQQQQPLPSQQLHTGSNMDSCSHQEKTSSQPRDVGKSFLLMDNDDINDSIWGRNGIPSSINGFSATPQPSTPILDWGTGGRKSSSFFLPQTTNAASAAQSTPTVDIPTTSMQGIPISASSGSSMPPPFNLLGKMQSAGSSNLPNVMGSSNDFGIASRKSQTFVPNSKQPQQGPQPGNSTSSQPQVRDQSLSNPTGSGSVTSAPSVESAQKVSQGRTGGTRASHSGTGAQKGGLSSSSSSSNVTGSGTISQADLSLLARVPPPANPADQNPPCNTLYVGNLPPDATEQELRQLFSGQQGFRRLSFRNKNSNGNGHGPMCFVEFEDVSFATRALAELYGSQLPRASVSNKGGIRLSFSKNPLGVRGPNNRRGGGTNAISGQGSGASNSAQSFSNYNYSGGYNKT